MKKQIRKSVFETNSSSSHTLTVQRRSDYMNWELDDFKSKQLVYESQPLFDVELLYKKDILSSGSKLAIIIGLLNSFVCDRVTERLSPYKHIKSESFELFDLSVYGYIRDVLKEIYDIDFLWKGWTDIEPLEYLWLDESSGETLYSVMQMVLGDEVNIIDDESYYRVENKVIEVLNNEELFKRFLKNCLTDKTIIFVSEYEEW